MRLLIIPIFLIALNFQLSGQSDVIFQDNFPEYITSNVTDSPPVIQDQGITDLVNKHIIYNQNKKGINGYRIQIYSGVGGATRKEAVAVKTKFLKLYPDVPVDIVYDEPYFKVRAGLFRKKSDGYKLFLELKQHFPGSYFIIENEMELPPL